MPNFSNDSRTRRQQKIVSQWESDEIGQAGTVQACTGFGKTWVALMSLKRAQEYGWGSDFLVVVPTRYLKEQWEEDLDEWEIDATVEVINTVVKSRWSVDILILDEIHRYASEIFGTVFSRVEYESILGLTATLPSDEKYDHIRQLCPVFDKVTLAEAQQEGWVSDFLVYNLPVELSPEERAHYEELNSKYHSHFSTFNHNFNWAMSCLKNKDAARDYAKKKGFDYQTVRKDATQFIRNVQERKKFLYNLDTKMDVAEKILSKFQRMSLVFSQTKDAASAIAKRYPKEAAAYHSGMTKKEQEEAIHAFCEPTDPVRILSTARALDQGADLPMVSLAVVIAGTSKPLQSIQRMGRTLRKNDRGRAMIVELYATDTQDEKWLKKRQRKTPNHTIRRVRNVEDIVLDPSDDKLSIAA